ncbi:MAG: hypothetical protein V1900_04255 [Candidatus Aenigmatarchaeota archaeon]
MKLHDAIALADDKVSKKADGYFLVSCFAAVRNDKINEWVLHFFNPKTNKTVDCFVGKDAEIGEVSDAIKEMKKLEIANVKISAEQALSRVDKTGQIFMILHNCVWTINVIETDMSVTNYEIDANSGKVIKKDSSNLVKIL